MRQRYTSSLLKTDFVSTTYLFVPADTGLSSSIPSGTRSTIDLTPSLEHLGHHTVDCAHGDEVKRCFYSSEHICSLPGSHCEELKIVPAYLHTRLQKKMSSPLTYMERDNKASHSKSTHFSKRISKTTSARRPKCKKAHLQQSANGDPNQPDVSPRLTHFCRSGTNVKTTHKKIKHIRKRKQKNCSKIKQRSKKNICSCRSSNEQKSKRDSVVKKGNSSIYNRGDKKLSISMKKITELDCQVLTVDSKSRNHRQKLSSTDFKTSADIAHKQIPSSERGSLKLYKVLSEKKKRQKNISASGSKIILNTKQFRVESTLAFDRKKICESAKSVPKVFNNKQSHCYSPTNKSVASKDFNNVCNAVKNISLKERTNKNTNANTAKNTRDKLLNVKDYICAQKILPPVSVKSASVKVCSSDKDRLKPKSKGSGHLNTRSPVMATKRLVTPQQRQQIYALNEAMTQLENESFRKFCIARDLPLE